MALDTIIGLLVIVIGGIASGLFTFPFVYVKGWQWENYWFVYTVYGLVFAPWILVFFSVDDPINVYKESPTSSKLYAVGFGMLWGVGSVLFGQGVSIVGNALGFAIILGLTSALGTAIPLVILHPGDVGTTSGICTWAGLGIVCIGLVALAKAGILREREQAITQGEQLLLSINEFEQSSDPPKRSFMVGLIFCLLSGVFSCMLNLAIAFGDDLSKKAKDTGTSYILANNATWALTVCAGSLANAAYCTYLLTTRRTWSLFFTTKNGASPVKNAILSAVAGVLWFGGNVVYGVGSELVGDLGTVLGWPIFLSLMILTSNLVGVFTGEWKGSLSGSRRWGILGLLLLLAAVVTIAVGSK